jgi:hypothetical protein
MKKSHIFYMATIVTLLSQCGSDSSETKAPATLSFTSLHQANVFSDCKTCHVPEGEVYTNGVEIDFTSLDTAYTTLTTLKSASPSNAACSDIDYVTARTPTSSYLAAVIIEEFNTSGFADKENCEPYNVHIEESYLTTAQQNDVKKWITDGAGK